MGSRGANTRKEDVRMDAKAVVDTPEEAAFRAQARAWLQENAAQYVEPPAIAWEEDELVRRARD
jgi:hypothetical protein